MRCSQSTAHAPLVGCWLLQNDKWRLPAQPSTSFEVLGKLVWSQEVLPHCWLTARVQKRKPPTSRDFLREGTKHMLSPEAAVAQKRGVAHRGSWQEPLAWEGCVGQSHVCYSFVQANHLRNICDHLIHCISLIHPINTIVSSQVCFFWKKNPNTYHLLEDFAPKHTSKEAELR